MAKEDWMARQLEIVRDEVKNWPAWKREDEEPSKKDSSSKKEGKDSCQS